MRVIRVVAVPVFYILPNVRTVDSVRISMIIPIEQSQTYVTLYSEHALPSEGSSLGWNPNVIKLSYFKAIFIGH